MIDTSENGLAPLMLLAGTVLDRIFNGGAKGSDRKIGFVVVVAPQDSPHTVYLTNLSDRREAAELLRDQADWLEEHADDDTGDVAGHA